MTYEELDALAEVAPNLFGTQIQVRSTERGEVRVAVPVMPNVGAIWREPTDPFGAVDRDGQYWEIGRVDGVLSKRKAMMPLGMRLSEG